MFKRNLARYDPNRHAAARPAYPGKFVVTREIPVSDIVFRPEDDDLAAILGGSPNPELCPIGTENLLAQPSVPQIRGGEKRQYLAVACDQNVHIAWPDSALYTSVCALRARMKGYDISSIPAAALSAEAFSDESIHCPFSYVGGVALDGGRSAPVFVEAVNPNPVSTVAT